MRQIRLFLSGVCTTEQFCFCLIVFATDQFCLYLLVSATDQICFYLLVSATDQICFVFRLLVYATDQYEGFFFFFFVSDVYATIQKRKSAFCCGLQM